MQEEIILPIRLRRNTLQPALEHNYRVYKSDGSFVAVQAQTAAEALRVSEVDNCLRIIKESVCHENLLEQEHVQTTEDFLEVQPLTGDDAIGQGRRVNGALVIHAPEDETMPTVPPEELFRAISLADLETKKMELPLAPTSAPTAPPPISTPSFEPPAQNVEPVPVVQAEEMSPVSQPMPSADGTLTPDEVERLLNNR